MSESAPCRFAHLDAAYVLGALAADERLELERHLPGCAACSRAVQELAGLPGLLAQVSPDVLESEQQVPPVPDTLLPALVQEVRRTQRRRRWTVGLAAAAAVLVALGVGTAVVIADSDDPAPTQTTTAPAHEMERVDGQTAVWGDLSLTPVGWGTRLDLTCGYEASPGSYYGEGAPTYSLVVHDRDGGSEHVASWKAMPGETVDVTAATALGADEIASVEVLAADGRPVLSLRSDG